MKRYPDYKESGVEWIGKIPHHWEVLKAKHVGSSNPSKNNPKTARLKDKPVVFLPMERVHTDGTIDQELRLPYSRLKNGYTYFEEGDILIAKVTPCFENGKIVHIKNLATSVGFGSTEFIVIRPELQRIFPSFLYFIFRSDPLRSIGKHFMTSAIGLKRVPTAFVENFQIPIPVYQEQTQIANFLDQKTKQIDELIRIKERQIELLQEQRTALINQAVTNGLDSNVEMKPSGVEWIGEIPKHWEVKRIKYLASVISKGTTPTTIGREIFDEGEIRFIKVENIVDNQIELKPEHYIDEETNQMLKRSQLKENDVLFVIAGTIGKVSLVRSDHLPANTNQAISFIRLHENELPKFIYYWLQSDNIQKIMWLEVVQSAQPNLSMENLGNLYIPYPGITEQHRIVNHITDKTQTIVQLLQQAYKQIKLLQEYRQSLISEAVTGKIDVRNEV